MPARPTEPAWFNCLGKRSQPGSIPGRGPCLERLVLQLAYASGDQSRLDKLMRFFTVMYRTYLV